MDTPEIEEGVYVPEAVWAARVLGKPIVSAEAFTHVSIRHGNLRHDGPRGEFTARVDPTNAWRTRPPLLRALSNAHFARGLNRLQIHSFSYSPPGVPAPGWRMYAEIHLNRNVPWWPELGGTPAGSPGTRLCCGRGHLSPTPSSIRCSPIPSTAPST